MLFNLAHRRKVSALCLLYMNYHSVDLPMNRYLNHFVTARNTEGSAALCELALIILRCRIDQFSRSFVAAAARLWNFLLSGVCRGGTLSSFKSAVNSCLLRA